MAQTSALAQLFQKHQQQILEAWIKQQLAAASLRADRMTFAKPASPGA